MCIHTETNGVSYHSTVCFIQSSFPKLTGCKISPIHLRRWTKVYSVTQGLTVPRAGPVPRGALISFWTHYFKRVLPSFPLRGNFMVVQWLGFGTFISGAPGSIPRQGTKIPQALWHDQKKKKCWHLKNWKVLRGKWPTQQGTTSSQGNDRRPWNVPEETWSVSSSIWVHQFAASGCGSFSQGCTTQEGSSGVIIHPRTGCSPRDDGQKVSILMYIQVAFLRV